MDGGNEQRVAIKFCFKAGLSATETLVLVQKDYGNEAVNRSNVFRWYSRFWDGRELVEDDRERWPSKIDSNWGKHCCCCWFSKNDRRIASRMIAESLNIPKPSTSSCVLLSRYFLVARRSKKRNFRQLFRNFTTAQKHVYMPMELIFEEKKVVCLSHVSSIFKKISHKTFGPNCVFLIQKKIKIYGYWIRLLNYIRFICHWYYTEIN
jgi:hypothetical protein